MEILTRTRSLSTSLPDLRSADAAFEATLAGRTVRFTPRLIIGGTEWSLRSGRTFLGTVTIEGFLTFYTVGYGVPHEIGTATAAVRVLLAKSGVAV